MKKLVFYGGLFLTIDWLLGCGGNNTSSNVQSPGGEKTAKTNVLEAGADMLQDKTPLTRLNMYLDGFHFYNGDTHAQMEAHHYCTPINDDLTQCIIYDGNGPTAKIMGVEYIVSEKLFKTLPAEERTLWHSHVYEVKSGELIAPGIPEVAEHELMEKLVSTYGKTFHTWHTDQELTLPLGHPLVMMGFTKDGMLNPAMLADRDRRFGVSTGERKKNRADISTPAIQPGANAWQQGEVRQLKLDNTAGNSSHHASPTR